MQHDNDEKLKLTAVLTHRNVLTTICAVTVFLCVAVAAYMYFQQQAVNELLDAVQNGSRKDVDAALVRANRLHVTNRAIPLITEVLKGSKTGSQPQHHTNAKHALSQIGPAAIPSLLDAMTKPSYVHGAVMALTDMREVAVADLRSALASDPQGKIRAAASHALFNMAANDVDIEVAIPTLTEAVRNDVDLGARAYSANALGYVGDSAKSALPALLDALHEEHIQLAAARAIASIAPEHATEAVPAMVALLDDPDPSTRWSVVYAIGEFGPHGELGTDALLNALKDSEFIVRATVVSALGSIKNPPEKIIAALLLEMEHERSVNYRRRIISALGALGPVAKDAIPKLTEALKDDELDLWASDALEQIDPDAYPDQEDEPIEWIDSEDCCL